MLFDERGDDFIRRAASRPVVQAQRDDLRLPTVTTERPSRADILADDALHGVFPLLPLLYNLHVLHVTDQLVQRETLGDVGGRRKAALRSPGGRAGVDDRGRRRGCRHGCRHGRDRGRGRGPGHAGDQGRM